MRARLSTKPKGMVKGSPSQRRFLLATSQAICEKGELRQVVVEAQDGFAVLRLRGSKEAHSVPWSVVYHLAAAQTAERELRARRAELGL